MQWSTGADGASECVVETSKGVERWVIGTDLQTIRLS
jgi:hypothetical protein